ncbi:hypothetical protein [Chitinilyticum aquatile]|uniref:hypothetical protein n=1 Tax=Chitinilyticum aquatile TaxID=362520 RepID=UPI0003FEB8EF|nr:hypothetical protein [Chitinilyticum aquatile]
MICQGCDNDRPPSDFRHNSNVCRLCVNRRQRERMAAKRTGVPAAMALRLLELGDPFNRGMMQ